MVGYNTGGQNISGQFGLPLMGVAGAPLPFTGNYFWVDGTFGSDGNTGGPQDPLKTLTQAHTKCLAGNNDVVFFSNTYSPSATLVWSKNNTHLIGLGAVGISSTALISVASTAATSGAFSPLVNVTATGCLFQNITAKSGINQASTQVCWAEAGGNNQYLNCSFNQVGNATAAAQAGCRALTIASVGTSFNNCTIGGDSIVRATGTNFTAEFLAGSGSTEFNNCSFVMWSSVAANAQINAATATMAGYVILDNCLLVNDMGNAGAVANTLALTISATAGGVVLLTSSTAVLGGGATVATTGQLVYITSPPSTTGGNRALNVT